MFARPAAAPEGGLPGEVVASTGPMNRRSLASLALVLSACAPAVAPPPASPAVAVEAPVETPVVAAPPVPEPAKPAPVEPVADGDDLDDEASGGDEMASPPHPTPKNPLLSLRDEELVRKLKTDPASLGSISVGQPSAGLLVNGVQMPAGTGWFLLDPPRAFATTESVEALARCIETVQKRFDGTPALPIGHFSAKGGGRLSPHRSHQSGRDVDLGYYFRGDAPRGFVTGTEANLDLPRTWLLVKTAVIETPVDMIFIDTSIQRLLADHAIASGEDPAFVDDIFQVRGKNARAPVRHVRGHGNHLHIRFHSPVAEALGVRLARALPRPDARPAVGVASAPSSHAPAGTTFAQLRARSGDTLVVWAKRYGTSIEDIQRANGLTSTALKIGNVYKIPQKAPPLPPPTKAPPAKAALPSKKPLPRLPAG